MVWRHRTSTGLVNRQHVREQEQGLRQAEADVALMLALSDPNILTPELSATIDSILLDSPRSTSYWDAGCAKSPNHKRRMSLREYIGVLLR